MVPVYQQPSDAPAALTFGRWAHGAGAFLSFALATPLHVGETLSISFTLIAALHRETVTLRSTLHLAPHTPYHTLHTTHHTPRATHHTPHTTHHTPHNTHPIPAHPLKPSTLNPEPET